MTVFEIPKWTLIYWKPSFIMTISFYDSYADP